MSAHAMVPGRNAPRSAPAPGGSILQRACRCGSHAPQGEPCRECRRRAPSGRAPAALWLGPSGDGFEREAEQIAVRVMDDAAAPSHRDGSAQLRRRTGGNAHSGEVAPLLVHDVLASPGRPLDPGTREFFEARLGHDFSHVRVHDDNRAAESARSVGALAYTVGEDVVFARGRYDPVSSSGVRLLAHELTHVVQQADGDAVVQRSLAGCQDLLSSPSVVSLLSGSLVHRIIAAHFQRTVQGARSVVIPGASAGPLRSADLCGGPSPVITPQVIGGAARRGDS